MSVTTTPYQNSLIVWSVLGAALAQRDQHGALDCRVRQVLDLDPIAAASRAIATVASLGDDPLEKVSRGGHVTSLGSQPAV
jgi:hypothetical protein